MPLFSRHNSPARANAPASARLAAPATRHMPVAPPAPGAMASTLLKRYRPLETRATGGFGSVEVCMDTRLQRRVAIKRIPLASPLSVTPESTRAAALAEARTASMLQHPNIVSVIDFSYDAEYAYLVMEYIDGMSLEEFLAAVEGSSLTYDECAAIADALVQALAFAHENGVLHLDIKPGNVLIDHNGHVKLTDFGMATLTSAAGFGGARGGTIGYMAPEQLRGEIVDERSDTFSLAAVLYESLCATAPFRAGTPADSLKRIEKGVIYPSSLLADITQNTEEALLAALDPDPAQRPASVQEFGDWFLPGLGSSREGKKSLARIIAQLTSDEAADAEDAESVRERRVWELDPAEGYLGSRTPRARAAVSGVVSGLSVAASTASILAAMGLEPGAIAAAAAAMGVAGGIAPQIGSALIAAGFITMVLNATDLIAVLPVVIPASALFIGWWYVWGRTYAPASTALSACLALGTAAGDPLVLAGVAAALAGYFLPPVPAAAACALGIPFAQLLICATRAGGVLSGTAALRALANPEMLAGTVVIALAAALAALALARHERNMQSSRGNAMLIAGGILPGIMVVLLLWLANPMENPLMDTYSMAIALGSGALSSIIMFICVYTLGYRRDMPEGDRP